MKRPGHLGKLAFGDTSPDLEITNIIEDESPRQSEYLCDH